MGTTNIRTQDAEQQQDGSDKAADAAPSSPESRKTLASCHPKPNAQGGQKIIDQLNGRERARWLTQKKQNGQTPVGPACHRPPHIPMQDFGPCDLPLKRLYEI